MLNHDKIILCMRVFHSVVVSEKTPSKRCRIRSSINLGGAVVALPPPPAKSTGPLSYLNK